VLAASPDPLVPSWPVPRSLLSSLVLASALLVTSALLVLVM
jgi:hypothetical protein